MTSFPQIGPIAEMRSGALVRNRSWPTAVAAKCVIVALEGLQDYQAFKGVSSRITIPEPTWSATWASACIAVVAHTSSHRY
jgi:hypothetical protein